MRSRTFIALFLAVVVNASQAQSGKKLTAQQVRQLVDSAARVKTDLGCQ